MQSKDYNIPKAVTFMGSMLPFCLLYFVVVSSRCGIALAYVNCGTSSTKLYSRRSGGGGSCSAMPSSNFGLLRNIDAKSADSYSQDLKMDSIDDIAWLMDRGLAWKAAEEDAKAQKVKTEEYLDIIAKALAEFGKSKKVHDREDFYRFLEMSHDEDQGGLLQLILGGKSVGKSLVLNDFKKKLENDSRFLPLLVDGRDNAGAPLSEGILKSYKDLFTVGIGRFKISEKDALKALEVVLESLGVVVKSLAVTTDWGKQILNTSGEQDDQDLPVDKIGDFFSFLRENGSVTGTQALESFVRLSQAWGRRPVLIIDEANEVLGLGEGKAATASTLKKIVQLTKQSRQLNVIMASSEYAYPYQLEMNNIVNLNDIENILFAGEIPPKSMWDLLVTKKKDQSNEAVIGMGENLASLMMASYGGHFFRTLGAVRFLRKEKENFFIAQGLNPISEGITTCLESHPMKSLHFISQMAEFGFAPVLKYQDEAVQKIVKENLAGVVSPERSTIVGLPADVWHDDFSFGLVPTSQSARLVMARKVLYQRARRRRGWRRLLFWRRE